MNAIWISLKENVSCGGSKMTVLAWLPEKMVSRKNATTLSTQRKLNENDELTDGNSSDEYPFIQSTELGHYYNIRNTFHELEIGDPSRNIIEMIFRASSAKPKKCRRKIRRVLKVNNSDDTLAKFEKYRETVIKSSCKSHHHHPRNTVDGNELLQFYGTTMSCCCNIFKTEQISEFCRDTSCRACRVIQSGFNTCYNTENGVRVNVNSEQMSEDKTVIAKATKVKRAVIVCRTIAGRVVEGRQEECDSALYTKNPKSMILRNPAAVLPCFVVVFD